MRNAIEMALKPTLSGLDIPVWIPTAMRVNPLTSVRRNGFPFNGDYCDCVLNADGSVQKWFSSLKGASTDRDYVDAGLVWSETQRCWGIEEK